MHNRINLKPSRTYKTFEGADKAAQAIVTNGEPLRYLIVFGNDGRYFPVFVGESAVSACVHFTHCVVA